MRRYRAVLLLPLAFPLPGCSFLLGLTVASASGTPVFERERRRCVTALRVSSDDALYAAHPPDPASLTRRLIWVIEPDRRVGRCLRFPITYGRPPAGSVQVQPPEPLVPGITYVATGAGAFNIGRSISFQMRDGAVKVVDSW